MDPRRYSLQAILEELLGNDQVYFQPPENVSMQYPCIVYNRDNAHRSSADNHGYLYVPRYLVTLISRDPDNPAVEAVARLPQVSALRSFLADGLTHDVFELYY